jgi:Iron-Sulfur binding protein C terminal
MIERLKQDGVGLNIWQVDGRPMSGDIGSGASLASIKLAQAVYSTHALPWADGHSLQQHHIQLAGGTNDRTAPK